MTDPGDRQLTPGAEQQSVSCTFCKKGPATVCDLIECPELPGCAPAYICQECVELCSSIFQHRRMLGGAEEETEESIINAATHKLLEEKIDQSLSILTSLETDIIRLRYGLTDGYTYTLKEVGEKMGISPEHVADIERRAVAKLRSSGPQT